MTRGIGVEVCIQYIAELRPMVLETVAWYGHSCQAEPPITIDYGGT